MKEALRALNRSVLLSRSPQVAIHPRHFLLAMRSPTLRTSQFALKGCLTAGLCYIVYNEVDWPGISTAVTTVSSRRFLP